MVPCYNEGARLNADEFLGLVTGSNDISLLFVNDGSRDDTEQRLRSLCARDPGHVTVLSFPQNQGKAEAVRQGLLRALAQGADIIGYADADLGTPIEEMLRLVEVLRASEAKVLIAARVAMLGRTIDRKARRHYLGRVFATAASLTLRMRVYDTQCGAKLFRRTPALTAALSTPFLSRWVFDVELLGRLSTGACAVDVSDMVEEPLLRWSDVPGSRLRASHMVRAAIDLGRIALDLRRRRSKVMQGPPFTSRSDT